MDTIRCELCRFYQHMEHRTGQCRRLPPEIPQLGSQQRWPEVEADEWCGAFEPEPARSV